MYKDALVLSVPHTGFTHPSSVGADVCVGFIKKVSALAVRLSSLTGSKSIAIPDVLSMSHDLQVRLSATGHNLAKMANFHPFGNGLAKGEDVCIDKFWVSGSRALPRIEMPQPVLMVQPNNGLAVPGLRLGAN